MGDCITGSLEWLGIDGTILSVCSLQESSASEVRSTASGGKYATLGGHTEAQRKKDAKKLEKEAR